jgi:hypothetical protein
MKHTLAFMFMLLAGATAFGQSKSFDALSNAFADRDNVISFSLGGLPLKWTSDEDDKTFNRVRDVRFLTIPRQQFDAGDMKLSSVKRNLSRDSFEEMFSARDEGDNVSIYLQDHGGDTNVYFVLVEDDDNVVAIEIKGYIDPKSLKDKKTRSKLTGM